MRLRSEVTLLSDKKGLIDMNGDHLTEGEPFVLVVWYCPIVGCFNN